MGRVTLEYYTGIISVIPEYYSEMSSVTLECSGILHWNIHIVTLECSVALESFRLQWNITLEGSQLQSDVVYYSFVYYSHLKFRGILMVTLDSINVI